MTTFSLTPSSTVTIQGAGESKYGDDIATLNFDGSGAVSETGMTSFTLTPTTVEIKGANSAKYGDDTATLDFDGSGNISNSSNLVSFKISTDSSDVDAIKLDSALGGIDIDAKTKINIKAENNSTDAIVLNASAGGIDIDSSGILALDSDTRIDIGINADRPIDIDASTLDIDASGALTIDSDTSIAIGTTADKPIDIDATTLSIDTSAALTIDSASTLSIDAEDDSNFTVTGSNKDLTLEVTGGSTQVLAINSAGTGTNAIDINTTAGGIDIDSKGILALDSDTRIDIGINADKPIDIDASTLDIDASGALTLDSDTSIAIGTTADRPIDIDASTLDIDASGALTLDSDTSIAIGTTSDRPIDIDASTLDIDASGALTIDSSTFSIDSANGPSNITTTATSTGQDFTISLAGQYSSKLNILSESTGTGNDNSGITIKSLYGGLSAYSKEIMYFSTASGTNADISIKPGGTGSILLGNSTNTKVDIATDTIIDGSLTCKDLSLDGSTTITKNLNVLGNINVTGNINAINADQIHVEDKLIILGSVTTPTDTTATGGGLLLKGTQDKKFTWATTNSGTWESTENIKINRDNSKLSFGTDSDVELTHVHNDGLLLTSGKQIQYGNSTEYISGNSTDLTIASGNDIKLQAITKAENTTQSTTHTDGSLIVSGGVGIAKNMYIAGSINKYTHLSSAHGSTTTITVKVITKTASHRYNGTGSSAGYTFDNVEAPILTLTPGRTYRFDQSDNTNGSHPLLFYLESDKTNQYSTNITTNGTAGSAGAYTELVVTDTTPTVLHYQCANHGYMGNAVYVNTNVLNSNHESIVRNNIRLQKDSAILSFGTNNDVSLTHVHDTGLLLNSNRQIQYGSSTEYISGSGSDLTIASGNNIIINTTGIDINASGPLTIDSAGGASNISHTATTDGDFTIAMDAAGVNASLILSSTGTAADALQVTASAGGMDITSSSVMDITSGGAMNITTSASNSNITINPHGSGTLALGSSSNTAINLDAKSFSIDAAGDSSNITLATDGDAEDLTIGITGTSDSSLVLSSTGTGTDALQITASAGGMDITSSNIMDITSGGAMNITTSANNSDITINPHSSGTLALGSGSNTAITLDAGSFSIDGSNSSSNITLASSGNGQDLTIGLTGNVDSSLILNSTGTGADSIKISALASGGEGGIDIDSGTGGIDINTTGATNITADATSIIKTTTGNLTVDSIAGTLVLDGHTGVTIDASNSGNVEINAASGTINIGNDNNANSINIGASATARTITIGNDASTKVDINAIAIELDSADTMTLSSGGILAIDTVGTDPINIGTESAAKTITIGNDASTKVDINALAIELDSAGTIAMDSTTTTILTSTGNFNIDAADAASINIGTSTTGSHDTSAINIGTSATARTITIGNDASTKVDVNALAIELDSAGTIAMDSTTTTILTSTGNFNIDAADASSINIGTSTTGTHDTSAINIGTSATARTISIGNDASTKVDINATAIELDSVGSMTLSSGGTLEIDTVGTDAINIGTESAAKTITIGNDASTKVDINALAIELDSAGTIAMDSTTTTILTSTGNFNIDAADAASINIGTSTTGSHDTSAINIGTSATARTITIGNDASTKVDINATAIELDSVGSMTLSSGGALEIDTVGTDAINIGTESAAKTITIGNDASTKVDINALAIELDSAGTIAMDSTTTTILTSTGNFNIDAADAASINIGTSTTGTHDTSAINIGTSATARTITIGNDASTKVDVNAIAIELDSVGSMTLSSGGTLEIDTVGTDAINIGTENAAKTITIGNDASTKVDVNAIAIELDSVDTMTLSSGGVLAIDTVGTDPINIGTESAAKTITIGNDASTKVDINALAIELDSAGTIAMDSTTTTILTSTGNFNIDAADAASINIGTSTTGTHDTSAINIGTSATARTITIGNDASTKVDVNAIAIELDSVGSMTLSSGGTLEIDTVGTDAINIGTENAAKTITIGNDASTKVDVNALAIELDSAGSIVSHSTTTTQLTSITDMSLSSGGTLAIDTVGTDPINIGTEAAAKTITIGNDASTKVDINALAIELDSAGSIVSHSTTTTQLTSVTDMTLSSGGTLAIDTVGTDPINIGTESAAKTITIGNDASTKVDINALAIELDSAGTIAMDSTTTTILTSTGNFNIDAADAASINIGTSTTGTHDTSAINIGTSATARTITIGNDASTKVDVNAIAIELDSVGSMTLSSGGTLEIDTVGTDAINIGTENAAKTITIGNDASTKVDINATAIELDVGNNGIIIDTTGSITLDGTGGINIGATNASAIDLNATTLDIDATSTINIDAQTSIDIGNNVSAPIGIGTSGNTTRVKGDLIVDGLLTLNQPATGDVNAKTLNVSEDGNFSQNVNISGNLNVTGNINSINADQIHVEDKLVILGSVASPDNNTANGGGLLLKGATDKKFTWSTSNNGIWESTEHIQLPTNKKIQFSDTNEYISSDGTDLSVVSGGALTYTSAAASTWTIGAGDLTLDVTGDIILDADGGDVSLKDAGTQFLKFTNNSGNCEIYNGVADTDIIFKNLGGNEICRIDGSAESLLIASSKKIEFADSSEYITSNGTDLSIVSGGALTYTTAAASTWTIGGGNLTLDVTGNIILDSQSGTVSVSATTASSTTGNGALTIAGGLGIGADVNIGDDLSLLSDEAVLNFGADRDVRLTHVQDTGLLLNDNRRLQFKNSAVYINCDEENHLNLYAGEQININIAGADELAITASTSTFGTNIVIPNSGTIGCVSDTNAISISNNTVTFDTNLIIPDAGTIGSSSDTDAISISAAGVVAISATTESSIATDGALTIAGGLGVAKDVNIGDDLSLLSDGSILNFGAGRDVKLTHVHDTGLLLNNAMQLQFRDGDIHISSDADGYMNVQADTGVNININGTDELAITSSTATFGTNLVIPDAGTIGSASDTDAISISAGGVVAISATTASSTASNGALTVAGGLGVGADINVGDDLSLLSDESVLNFGADRDVKLTHVQDTGLLLNDNRKLQFRDGDIHISSDADGYMNVQADTGINININGTDELAITSSTTTFGTNLIIPDAGTIGSASDTDAISISAGGVVAISATTASSTASNGALTVSGGLGVNADINVGDDLSLLSDESVLNFGADRDINLTHIHNIGLRLNGTINKSTSGLIDGVSKGSFTYTNPCGDLTANTNAGDTTIKSFDTTAYELAAISNYVPPTSATHMEITFNFTIYDENISSEFTLDLLIGSAVADNNIIKSAERHKYKQKYKMESRNQTNEYSKTFHLTLGDLDPVWGNTARNIKFKFTGTNSNKIYLFTNSLTSTTDKYTTSNVQYPSISVKSHFY